MNALAIIAAAAAVAARAAAMDESEAVRILTLAEEPELLLDEGEEPPVLDPLDVDAARLICSEFEPPTHPAPSLAWAKRQLTIVRLRNRRPAA